MYAEYTPLEILALMQHHGIPTRLIDFTHSLFIAAYFAMKEAKGDAVIFIVDKSGLAKFNGAMLRDSYSGPTHIEKYHTADKTNGASVMEVAKTNIRIAAQKSCFLVPGRISPEIKKNLIATKILIPDYCAPEFLDKLTGMGIDNARMFPELDSIGTEIRGFIATGRADVLGLE
jgi:hypothetical protein